jgi:hypothetical protein
MTVAGDPPCVPLSSICAVKIKKCAPDSIGWAASIRAAHRYRRPDRGSSQLTPRWRKPDSNRRYRVTRPRFDGAHVTRQAQQRRPFTFARASLLEEDGFEPSVPLHRKRCCSGTPLGRRRAQKRAKYSCGLAPIYPSQKGSGLTQVKPAVQSLLSGGAIPALRGSRRSI